MSYFSRGHSVQPGRIQMAKTLFGFSSAALIVSFIAGFGVADSQARHAPLVLAKAQPSAFKMMASQQQLPSEHFADYSLVFH